MASAMVRAPVVGGATYHMRAARAKKAMWVKPPTTSEEVVSPDLDVKEMLMQPEENLLIDRTPVAAAQRKYAQHRPEGLTSDGGAISLLVDADGRVWVPSQASQVKKQFYALAHHLATGQLQTL